MQRYIIVFLFLCLHVMARGQTDDGPLYYWFDSEHETLYSDSTSSGRWKQMVDVSQLNVGLHTFYVMTTDSKGRVSSPVMRQFYKIEQSNDGEQYRCLCYVDGEMFCQKEVSAKGGLIDMELDATKLSEGMHRIQLQVLTTSGVVSGIHNGFFLRTATTQELGRLRCMCYVDGMLFSEESMSAEGGALSMNLDASGLTEGLHSIQMQVITETGVVSGVYNGFFIRKSMEQEIGQFHCLCYVDGELFSQEKMSAEGGLLALDLDTNSLTEGLHRIQLQVMTKSGIISGAYNGFFLRTATSEELGQFLCMCYIDGEMYSQEKLSAEGGLLHLDLNASSLSEGMHRIQLQVMTENGTVSGTYNGFFLRIPTQEEQSNYSCIYAVDDETESHKFDLTGNDGVYHFDLDMSGLNDGLHHISYFLSSDKGVSSSPQTRFFIKSPAGGNAIASYQYWLNDDTEHMKTVTLPKSQNPFKLISLLPVEKVPVRSSQFHFEIKDGEPMMYAKNDFHVRFYDAGSRFTDETKQYVDYNVSRKVENVADLQKTQTEDRPTDNEVLWYMFESIKGDSVSFRLSQAATLQVFGPEGEEVYKAQGSTSVAIGGCHTWQDGIYYVALHDVTGSKPDITLTFSHYSKYDVVRQDVDVVGNGGCSTITFDGNGFKDLYAVDLYTEKGDTIHHVLIGHESDATTSVTFDFSGAKTGKYHALFRFAEGNKRFTNMLTVEEAVDIELATTVSYPSTFLRGSTTTYTLKITNNGNMTAYAVPISINITSRTTEGISQLSLRGLGLKSLLSYFSDADMVTSENMNSLSELSKKLGEDHYFHKVRAYDDGIRDSITIRSNLFFTNIAPFCTKEVILSIKTVENIETHFGVPTEWDATYSKESPAKNNTHRANWYCCHHELIECGGDMFSMALDGISLGLLAVTGGGSLVLEVGSCASSAVSNLSSFASQFICDHKKLLSWSTAGNTLSTIGLIASCGALKKIEYASEAVSLLINTYSLPASLVKCGNAKKKKPECTPSNGGTSRPVYSYDPNDIYGYLAESGSNAVREGQTDLYYRIEFENDTAFATAAAHQVVITDTLDAKKFNLSSYEPTRVKIGEKTAELSGDKDFVTTVDMRPEINAIAQVTGTFDEQKGIAQWKIESLDPMTMEPTDDPMEGVLPVNVNGSGIGEVSYNISLKPGLTHGSEVNNRAGIVFDNNEVIMTPTWTNIMDLVAPESRVTDVRQLNDSLAVVTVDAADGLSGVWRYDVYVQYGSGAWFKAAENVPADTTATVKIYEGMDHGFYVVATDSAGNVERKQAMREMSLNLSSTIRGDVNSDGQVGIADIVAVTGYMVGTNSNVSLTSADVNGDGQVGIADIVAITDIMAGTANMTSRQNARYKTYFVKRKE